MGCGHLAEFHSLIEICPDLALSFAQRTRQQVFENGTVATERGRMSYAASHDAGADDCNRLDLRHLFRRLFQFCEAPFTCVAAPRKASARRLRSSGLMAGI